MTNTARKAVLFGAHLTDTSPRCLHRRDPGSYSVPSLSSGALPSVFTTGEPNVVEGVEQGLLPPTYQPQKQQQQQQQQQWINENWAQHTGAASSTSAASPWEESFSAAHGEQGSPDVCQPDCRAHSEAFHDANMLLDKLDVAPKRMCLSWEKRKTDEVLSWLYKQATSDPLSSPRPDSPCGPAASSSQPTIHDAELLRICETPSPLTRQMSRVPGADS